MISLVLGIIVACAALLLFSGLDLLLRERGKIVERELQPALEAFDTRIAPRLGGSAERAELGAWLWMQAATAALGGLLVAWTLLFTTGRWGAWLETVVLFLLLLGAVRASAALLFGRSRLDWLARLAPLLRVTLWLAAFWTAPVGMGGRLAALGRSEPPENADERRESDIEALVEAGEEEGIIEAHERELVQSALEFGDKRLREIMVPRPDIVALPSTASFVELLARVRKTPFQRLPVYEGDLDHIVGVVATRELLRVPERQWPSERVGSHLAPVLFVPESATSFELLRQMQRRRIHVAVVISEYGAVAGLVTVSDLMEEIVGELPAESPDGTQAAVAEVPGQFLVLGSMDLDRLEEMVGVRLERREANTLGGLLAEHLGRIPAAGERVRLNGLVFEIIEANPVRVLKVRIVPAPAASVPN